MKISFEERKLSNAVIEFRAIRESNFKIEVILGTVIMFLLISSVFYNLPIKIHILTSIIIIVIIIIHRSYVVEESVLVIKDFGVQLRRKYASGSEYSEFLERDKISKVFIHECIKRSSICYQLAFLLHGENRLSLSFNYIYPGLIALKRVFLAVNQDDYT
jgi:hypothetical protein